MLEEQYTQSISRGAVSLRVADSSDALRFAWEKMDGGGEELIFELETELDCLF